LDSNNDQRINTGNALAPLTAVGDALEGDDVTHVIFILDRSGSMSGKEEDVIGGFNSYVDALRAEPAGLAGISYVRFDDHIELVWNDLPVADVPPMSADTYSVRGSTALLDAVGMTVSAVRDNPAHRYIVITNTDGHENASREWTADKVRALIQEREARGNWTFAFFGEGIDAWGEAAQYGYGAGAAMSHTSADIRDVYESKARVSNVMRSRGVRSTKDFAAAAAAVMRDPDLDEAQVEQILRRRADSDAPDNETESKGR
jgi:hypothetical protein